MNARHALCWLLPTLLGLGMVAAHAGRGPQPQAGPGPRLEQTQPRSQPESSRALRRMHDQYVLAFIDSSGFGMRRLPAMAPMLGRPVQGTPWLVSGLELIGVARHDPPRVFGGGLSMDVFHRPDARVPLERGNGRAITSAEQQVLRALEPGRALMSAPEGNGLRVTGAIRAGSECLGCHKESRAGDLLGAFVYHLQPVNPPPPSPPALPAQ